jgi:large subunit ribosomal protein L16
MFEMAGVGQKEAYEALRLAAQKLPIRCRIVERQAGGAR